MATKKTNNLNIILGQASKGAVISLGTYEQTENQLRMKYS